MSAVFVEIANPALNLLFMPKEGIGFTARGVLGRDATVMQ